MGARGTRGSMRRAFAVLGLPPTASLSEATRAYRKLVRAKHPDTRDEGAAIAETPGLREIYDAYHEIQRAVRAAPPPNETSASFTMTSRAEAPSVRPPPAEPPYLKTGPVYSGNPPRRPRVRPMPPQVR